MINFRSVTTAMLRKMMFGCLLQLAAAGAFSQSTVTVAIEGVPEKHNNETIFITGIFNRWVPGNSAQTMIPKGNGRYEIVLKNIPAGLFEYKFTRGDWKRLESTKDGRLVAPRNAIIRKDTVLTCKIEGWRDDFPVSTASASVQMFDSAFTVPQLNTKKKIWVYLPKDYAKSSKKYPVLYMHDGQDLFDEATSEGRLGPLEWGVDEVLDTTAKACIVVAIEHHPDKDGRLKEYFVHPNGEFSEVYGKQYLEFIVKTLKPQIDKKFRTLPGKATTWMSGGSMGGLITLYGGLMYPEVFGKLGVMSPSIWQDDGNIYKEINAIDPARKKLIQQQQYYFYAGDNENRIKPDSSRVQMHKDVGLATAALKDKINPPMSTVIYPTGRHGAWYWRLAFPALFTWFVKN